MTPTEQLKEKILTLQTQILENHPQMPVLLKTIHTLLRTDPEMVTVLDETEIGIVVSGLKRRQMTEIATTIAKSGTKTKSLKNLGVGDL